MTKHYPDGPVRCVKCFTLYCGTPQQECHICPECHDQDKCVPCQAFIAHEMEESEPTDLFYLILKTIQLMIFG